MTISTTTLRRIVTVIVVSGAIGVTAAPAAQSGLRKSEGPDAVARYLRNHTDTSDVVSRYLRNHTDTSDVVSRYLRNHTQAPVLAAPSPDTRDAAEAARTPVSLAVEVGAFDWADAGIGAAGGFAVALALAFATLSLGRRTGRMTVA